MYCSLLEKEPAILFYNLIIKFRIRMTQHKVLQHNIFIFFYFIYHKKKRNYMIRIILHIKLTCKKLFS